ncbi:hypothetical protein F5Y10DRAFT_257517 [Nemania abortiva]|nr:hypothetical protein F5Y10DRAFT_257517 [Nemania abortiva]
MSCSIISSSRLIAGYLGMTSEACYTTSGIPTRWCGCRTLRKMPSLIGSPSCETGYICIDLNVKLIVPTWPANGNSWWRLRKCTRCHWPQIAVSGRLKGKPSIDSSSKAWLGFGVHAGHVLIAQRAGRLAIDLSLP